MDVSFFLRLFFTAFVVFVALSFLVDFPPSQQSARPLKYAASVAFFIAIVSAIGVIWTVFA
jgi:hypothetical protein